MTDEEGREEERSAGELKKAKLTVLRQNLIRL